MKHERQLATTLKNTRLGWQLQKRKFQYQLLSNFGKNFASSDDDYEQHEQRFLGLLQKLLDIRKSLEHYRTTALPVYCSACASLGADVWCVVSVDAVDKGADAEKFRHAMCTINETKEVKNHFFNAVRQPLLLPRYVGSSLARELLTSVVLLGYLQDEVLAGALRFLDIHINAMKSVRSQIDHCKRVKLDFDCYEKKLSKMKKDASKKSSSVGSQRLEHNEFKLQKSREMLQAVTFDLYRVFAKYESERDTMLNGELEMVRQVMHSFYTKNAEATDFVIPEEVDRAALDAKTEQIFKAMVAKELAKQSVKELPAPAHEAEPHEAQEGIGTDPHAANTASDSDSLPSPAGVMVVPAPVSSLLASTNTNAPLAVDTPPSLLPSSSIHSQDESGNGSCSGNSSNNAINAAAAREEKESQPEHETSEKLKTIQLTRPKMQPLKHSRWRSSA